MTTTLEWDTLQQTADATGILADYKDITDPEYVGPGTWNFIHQAAFRATNHKSQLEFIVTMKSICTNFPCPVCKAHCTEYITNHPMESYLDSTLEIEGVTVTLGMFVWAWQFHNAVNLRLKKPLMSWDTAYNLYSQSDSIACSAKCLEAARQS